MEELTYHYNGVSWRRGNTPSFRKKGPCAVFDTGTVKFSQGDPCHYNRDGGPSEIHPTGKILFTNIHGSLHRTNGPAYIHNDGTKEYWVKGKQLLAAEFFLKYGSM